MGGRPKGGARRRLVSMVKDSFGDSEEQLFAKV